VLPIIEILVMFHISTGRWNCDTWHRETWQRGTKLNRSQRVEHPYAQEKIEHTEQAAVLSRFEIGTYSRL